MKKSEIAAEVEKGVTDAIYTEGETYDPEVPLVELGMDEIDTAILVNEMESELGVEIEPDEFDNSKTPNDLIDLISTKVELEDEDEPEEDDDDQEVVVED